MSALLLQVKSAHRAERFDPARTTAGLSIPSALDRLDRQFLSMMRAFRDNGGVVCADELAYLVRQRVGQPISVVARWIVRREAISLEWQAQTFLPLFQFDPVGMVPHACIRLIVRNLVDTFDDWEVAAWFASPNGWLGGAMPIEAVATRGAAVLDAARADRFVARG